MRAAVAAMVLATMLGAAPIHAAESPLMAMFDANHDGCVNLAEYQAYMDKGFRRMDANGDHVLEAAELPPGIRRHAPLTLARRHREVARQFHRQDTNHDACLRLKELMAPPR
ncbi:MAG TPA: hypothetical protein VFL78_00525 [Rhodanobacteraceae bacterium]|nr:hypothetical protein [Rhodanobacteraceae bacterium]